MCRSIKTLRLPYRDHVTEEDTQVAALQYIWKITSFRKPLQANSKAFDRAVREIARVSDLSPAALEERVPA